MRFKNYVLLVWTNTKRLVPRVKMALTGILLFGLVYAAAIYALNLFGWSLSSWLWFLGVMTVWSLYGLWSAFHDDPY